MTYVETDCTITHAGRVFEAGGAVVLDGYIVAYIGKDHQLTDWHGNVLGRYREVSSWPIQSWMGDRMYQVEAVVDGIRYTGRTMGEGMLYRGKRKVGR